MAASKETAPVEASALRDAGDGAATVTLVAGGTRVVAHRAVLAAGSPVFAAMFRHNMLEASTGQVTIPDVEGPVLSQLLAYMSSLEAPQLSRMAPQLLAAADKYGVSGLKAQCERQLATQLAVQNAAATAVLAVRHSCPGLTAAAVAFMKANLEVLATQGWADAVLNHPRDVLEVSQWLGEPPAETRSLSEEDRGRRVIQMAEQGAEEALRALLSAGADVGARDEGRDRMTALQLAAIGGHLYTVRCLVEAGAEVDARDTDDCTPLHSAAYRGHTAVVRLLLASSADSNARNRWRRTPLHDAAERGHPEAAAALLEAGADRGARDEGWCTPLDLARHNDRQQLVEILS